ncbi:MAG: 50S ribosomal protein L18 [Candidatus Wildermuthbacteria bacterium]|nr:50S ribosomal protein L18 [Candidatus Wildermuthbacteria bacterium]
MKIQERKQKRERRHKRVRSRLLGTSSLPRLVVFRSNKKLHAQLVDDQRNKTIASVLVLLKDAGKAGTAMAEKAKVIKVTKVMFDRGGYKYHGNVKKFAEAAREGGLQF